MASTCRVSQGLRFFHLANRKHDGEKEVEFLFVARIFGRVEDTKIHSLKPAYHLKMHGRKTGFLLGMASFVSFRECKCY